MLSRVADSIYWMSRQVERAENIARFLEITHNLALDQADDLIDPWLPLIEVTGDQREFEQRYARANAETVTQFLAFDQDYVNSMWSALNAARENARGVRETLSSEVFECLNEFYHFVHDAAAQRYLASPNSFFDAVRRMAIQWSGNMECTMPRDLGWHFANVGRLIERADKTSRILDVKYFNLLPRSHDVGTAVDDMQWSALLLAISGFEAYRREYHLVHIPHVVNYFLFKSEFPRSVLFCISGAKWSLHQIESNSAADRPPSALKLVEKLEHRLRHTSVQAVLAGGMHDFIDRLQTELNRIDQALSQDYFHHEIVA